MCYVVIYKNGYLIQQSMQIDDGSVAYAYAKSCNRVEYDKLTDKLFYGVLLTENHLNNAMETIKNYLFEGGEGWVLNYLGICYRTVERIFSENPEDNEVIKKCFVYIRGDRKGEELTHHAVEQIGNFLIGGSWYDDYYKYKMENLT